MAFRFARRRRISRHPVQLRRSFDDRSLINKLTYSPEKFTFVRAVDVALAIQNVSISEVRDFSNIGVEIKSKINFSSKFTDINVIEGLKDNYIELFTNLYGIAGIDGTLPQCYVEKFVTHNRTSRQSVVDFFDIFNNKILLLRYQYMKKYDLTCISLPLKKSIFGNIMFSLSGFGDHENYADKLIERSVIPEQFKISCHNLLWKHTRSSDGLRAILSSFFNVPVKIEQFVGEFDEVDKKSQSALGTDKNRFNKLGMDLILGNKTWNTMKGIRVLVGPLSFEKYLKFLPKNHSMDQKNSPLQKMKEIIKMYVPYDIKVVIGFYLDDCFVKATLLNGASRLNRDTFIIGKHDSRDVSISEEV
ncbi:MAG: type VI secretion system baseplate subunit TssG [Holosporales bacterium]|jgi:type VI secretion system protein ImpH|nr:type VI secretion system baseplate subunit TssG [Holosporales bacterium]